MTYDPKIHHRRSIRARRYDYATHGAYFITICAYQRQLLLGEVRNAIVGLTEIGCMVQQVWKELPARYAGVVTDEFVVMPNRVHGMIVLVGVDSHACPPTDEPRKNQAPARGPAPALPMVVQRFKSFTTHLHGRPLWQRNYFEHIGRNDEDMDRIREYIATNPARWSLDDENPNQQGEDEFDSWMRSFASRPADAQRAGAEARPYRVPGE